MHMPFPQKKKKLIFLIFSFADNLLSPYTQSFGDGASSDNKHQAIMASVDQTSEQGSETVGSTAQSITSSALLQAAEKGDIETGKCFRVDT